MVLNGNTTVMAQDSVWFWCEVKGYPPLNFFWSCDRGTLVLEQGDSVMWRAPDSSGMALLRVVIVDALGDSATDSLAVRVTPRVKSFVYWEGAVKAGTSVFFGDSAPAGYRLNGQSRADTTGAIFLIFLDEVNFQQWRNGEEYQFLIKQPAYQVTPFYDTIPATGIYYLVIDNTRNFNDASFWVDIRLSSP